jgi:SAM-dependent methyltransferase
MEGLRFGASTSTLKSRLRRVPLLARLKRRVFGPHGPKRPTGAEIIRNYKATLPVGGDLKVVFGDHWSNNPGWLVLTEQDQDITAPLQFDNESIDVIFAEHVVEHVPFVGAVGFFRESARILKAGGVCRIVCPMLDRMLHARFDDARAATYINNSLRPFFATEEQVLNDLRVGGLDDDPLPFFFAFLYMGHGHRFIWTSDLMMKVMKASGFRDARRVNIGEGTRADACIERRRRGIYLGHEWQEELLSATDTYDIETLIVEAVR